MEDFSIHLKNAIDFFDYLKSSNINHEYKEFKNQKSIDNYFMVLDSLSDFNINTENKFIYIRESETFNMSLIILNQILGNIIDESFVSNLAKNIIISGGNEVFNGNVVSINNQIKLLFDRLDTVSSVPVLCHEIMHLISTNKSTYSNYHVREVLSILMELIASNKVLDIDTNIDYYIKSSRVDSIKKQAELNMYYNTLSDTLTSDELQMIKIYTNHSSYTYNYSFIVAYNLYLKYLEDNNTLTSKLRSLLINNNDINELIDYYDISLENDKIIDNSIKLIRSL
jgi:hypothetical protein